jgi:hypothetical protein
MQRFAWRNVTNVAPDAAQQRIVFLTQDRLAEAEFQRLHGIASLAKFGCRRYGN